MAPDAPMDAGQYAVLDAIGETYWRYRARHHLFLRLWIRHRRLRPRYRVLDVGCGAGAFLAYLAERAPVEPYGIDLFYETLDHGRRRGLRALCAASISALPFHADHFDLVVAQDVLEHVEDDAGALAEVARVCRPGGLVLVVVPAYESLWSTRDVRLGHHRRYTLAMLANRVRLAGFRVVHETYSDLWLLPPLRLAVALAPRDPHGVADLQSDAPGRDGLLNRALLLASRVEALFSLRTRLPFGVAALVLGVRERDRERAPGGLSGSPP